VLELFKLLKLLALLGCSFHGFALIALTQDQHRKRVAAAPALRRRQAWLQRAIGGGLLVCSLLIALWRESGGGFAAIPWVLPLTAGVLAVAAGLTWKPHIFRSLIARHPT
jgi:Protein of unknown function (DUF3325)